MTDAIILESTNSPAASLTSEPEKLLPCPFCKGSPKMANGRSRRSDGTGWLRRVICLDCEAAGPQEHDDEEAAAMWNHRLSSPVSGTDMVSSDGLLPCPHCGGEAELTGYGAPEFWVHCPAIGCKAGTEAFGSKERAIAAWNRRTSSITSGTADTVAFVQEWLMSSDHAPSQWDRDFAAAIDARTTPTFTDAQIVALAERFCATPLPKTVCADLCATKPDSLPRTGTNLLTVDEARQMFVAIFSASPTPPIPIIAEAGERERVAKAINRVNWTSDAAAEERWQDEDIRALMFSQADAAIAARTPATLDNTAVEGQEARKAAYERLERHLDEHYYPGARDDLRDVATLTAKTEKAE